MRTSSSTRRCSHNNLHPISGQPVWLPWWSPRAWLRSRRGVYGWQMLKRLVGVLWQWRLSPMLKANFAARSYSFVFSPCKSPNLGKNPWPAAWQDELLAKVLKELRRRLFHIARDVAVIAKATWSLSISVDSCMLLRFTYRSRKHRIASKHSMEVLSLMVCYVLHVQCFVLNSCRSWDDKCWSFWLSPSRISSKLPTSMPIHHMMLNMSTGRSSTIRSTRCAGERWTAKLLGIMWQPFSGCAIHDYASLSLRNWTF